MAQLNQHVTQESSRTGKVSAADTWGYVLEQLALMSIFVAAIFFLRHGSGQTLSQSWTAVSVGLGMLCLGFGAGMLFYQRRQRANAASLRQDYAELSARAQALSAEMDEHVKRKQPPGR